MLLIVLCWAILYNQGVYAENECPKDYPSGCVCIEKSKSIYCENLQSVTKFPSVFKNDTRKLGLEKSGIETLREGDLANLTELEWFSMKDGVLRVIEEGALQHLTEVKQVVLIGNKLANDVLQNGTFDDLTSLKIVRLDYNANITELPDDWFKNSPIETLGLMYTSITRLSNGPFRHLSNLKDIILNNCRIKYVDKLFLKGTKVTHVNLYENPIVKIDPEAMDEQIVDFECRYCGLTDADVYGTGSGSFISKMTSLTRLSLGSNKISFIPKGVFKELTKLTTLNLFLNNISFIEPGAFDRLPSGASIAVQDNPFNCDCNMAWFLEYAEKNFQDTIGSMTCDRPANVSGKSFKSLKKDQFCCTKPAICGKAPGGNGGSNASNMLQTNVIAAFIITLVIFLDM